jgi:hypothetical protein
MSVVSHEFPVGSCGCVIDEVEIEAFAALQTCLSEFRDRLRMVTIGAGTSKTGKERETLSENWPSLKVHLPGVPAIYVLLSYRQAYVHKNNLTYCFFVRLLELPFQGS